MSVDESGGPQPALVTGYERQRAEPSRRLGRGGLYQRHDLVADGPAHAVKPGEQTAICETAVRVTYGP